MLLNLKTQNHKLIVVFFSVEPGFYEDGSFGIRIENVLLVKPVVLEVMTDDYWRFSLDTFFSFIIYLFTYLFIYLFISSHSFFSLNRTTLRTEDI